MKISCNKKQLVEAVTNTSRAVSTKSSIPALEGILIKTKENEIELCGYDLELGMKTSMVASIHKPGKIVISAKLFSDIVRRLPEELVVIECDEKNVITIESGASVFSIAGIPPEEYPELPEINDENNFVLQHDILKSMIRQTIFSVAESDAKPIHTGTLFELSHNQIKLISVDGYRLAMREEIIKNEKELSFVVPGKTLNEILKLLQDDDSLLQIHIGSRHILFCIGNYEITSRLLEGEFLDYHAAIPTNHKTEVTIPTRTFIDSVERVSLLITDRLKSPIRCVFEENEIKVSCFTTMGRANDQIDVKIDGEAVEMGFNNRFLLDALKNADCDEIRILLNGALSPMKVVPAKGNAFLFLVLPVRLKS